VLPDESGWAVVLPGVCRLTRVEGYGGAQTKPLLFIGRWRATAILRALLMPPEQKGRRCRCNKHFRVSLGPGS
jgi:hypothetical protein